MEELLDLCQPLPGDLFARRNDDDVVHVPGVELRPEEADTKLIELVEVDVREVLGADIPEWDASLSLRRAINHFAKKPVKPKEIPVHVGALLLELLEPLRKDFLEQVAVDRVVDYFLIRRGRKWRRDDRALYIVNGLYKKGEFRHRGILSFSETAWHL